MRRRHLLAAVGLIAPSCAPTTAAAPRGATASAPQAEHGTDATAAASEAATSTEPAGAPPLAPAGSPTTTVTLTVPTAPQTTTTTFVLPERGGDDYSDDEWWEAQPGRQEQTRADVLACIRKWEQGADGYATDTGNGFYGAYQFTLATWSSVGGRGNPARASAAEQDARAWALYQSRGLQPWPTPNARCAG